MTGTTVTPPAAPPRAVGLVPPPIASEVAGEFVAGAVTTVSDAALSKSSRSFDDSRLPALLLSTIVHTVLLVVLALINFRADAITAYTLLARQGEASAILSLQAAEPRSERIDDDGAVAEQPIDVTIVPHGSQHIHWPLTAADPDRIDSALRELASPQPSSDEVVPLLSLPVYSLEGRSPNGRLERGRPFGATIASERAVDAALHWLSQHQRSDGSWSFDLELDPCGGRCRHGRPPGSDTPTPATAATGLALLAFLGAGHTHHQDGPYRETVRRGIYFLRDKAADAEAGYDWQQGSMYGHGIALLALSEALSMSSDGSRRDSDLVELVSRGAIFTCVAQHDSGSWGYVPGSPGDMTVTGWQVLSLIAAKRGGAQLHTRTLADARSFVLSTRTDHDYWFGYKGPPGEPTTTAIGLTLMLYLGDSPVYTPLYAALTDMADRGPTKTNLYHDYYATLALHHSRHRDWDRWNTELREHLIATQQTEGHEAGSWHFADRWGDRGGRLYTTAMAAMTLEIYYRYQPLYASIDEFPL
jgi:hypothetical protein